MRKIVLQMQISRDGFVADANRGIDWIFESIDPAATEWIVARIAEASAHAMGSRTFVDMKAHWPTSTEPYAAPMNEIPKIVFSRSGLSGATTTRALADASARTPPSRAAGNGASWANPRVLGGALVDDVTRLKQESGREILVHGGASFARSLVATGLVDEYRLIVHPIALGHGLPIFSELAAPLRFALVESERFGSGIVANVLRPRS